MRFGFEAALGVANDAGQCPDPWDLGVLFTIHRYGSKRHRQYLKGRLKRDPLAARTLAKLIKRGAQQATAKAEPKDVTPPPADGVIDVGATTAPEPTFQDEYAACYGEALVESIDKGEIDVFTVLSSSDDGRDEVLALLEGWSGVTDGDSGEMVAFSPGAAAELLDNETIVKEGFAYAGDTVGEALVKHLRAFAKDHDEARQKFLEAGEKNSEGSSAGA